MAASGRNEGLPRVTPRMPLSVLAAVDPQSSHRLPPQYTFTLPDSINHRLGSFLLHTSVAFRCNTIYFSSVKSDCARIHASPKHREKLSKKYKWPIFVKIFISSRLGTLFIMSMLLFFPTRFPRTAHKHKEIGIF